MNKYKVVMKDGKEFVINTNAGPDYTREYTSGIMHLKFGNDAQFVAELVAAFYKIQSE